MYTRQTSTVLKWATSQSFPCPSHSLIISLEDVGLPGTHYCCLLSIHQVYPSLCALPCLPIHPGFFQFGHCLTALPMAKEVELVKTALEQVIPFL